MEGRDRELATVDELQHLGPVRIKPPYLFGTHEDDQLTGEYNKLVPNVLVIASNSTTVQREGHHLLSQQHANVVSRTTACTYGLRDIVHIDSWRKTAPFPYESVQTAPDTSVDKSGTPGSTPSYQWYARIEEACQKFRAALVAWRKCDQKLDWRYRNSLVDNDLPGQIAPLNRRHGEICGINDLVHVGHGINLIPQYRRFWTAAKMRRSA